MTHNTSVTVQCVAFSFACVYGGIHVVSATQGAALHTTARELGTVCVTTQGNTEDSSLGSSVLGLFGPSFYLNVEQRLQIVVHYYTLTCLTHPHNGACAS